MIFNMPCPFDAAISFASFCGEKLKCDACYLIVLGKRSSGSIADANNNDSAKHPKKFF